MKLSACGSRACCNECGLSLLLETLLAFFESENTIPLLNHIFLLRRNLLIE